MTENRIEFSAFNTPTSQSLAELELWPVPQGTPHVMVPVQIDLRFDKEIVSLPKVRIAITARKAKIRISLADVFVVRDSRFGDDLNDPYLISEVTESARKLQEREVSARIRGALGISRDIFGRLTAVLHGGLSNKSTSEHDNILKTTVKQFRIIYRGNNCWDVVEPLSPNILSGKYLGNTTVAREGERADPLCLLAFSKKGQLVDIWISVDRSDLEFAVIDQNYFKAVSRNREAVIGELLRRSVSKNYIDRSPLPPQLTLGEIILCHSRLEANDGN